MKTILLIIGIASRSHAPRGKAHSTVTLLMAAIVAVLLAVNVPVSAQEKMSKDEWQTQMASAKAKLAPTYE